MKDDLGFGDLADDMKKLSAEMAKMPTKLEFVGIVFGASGLGILLFVMLSAILAR